MIETVTTKKGLIRRSSAMLAALATVLATGSPALAQDAQHRTEPWNDEIIELFSSLPVQHGGRVKPLGQFAALHLLTFNGKRTLKLEDGTKLKPTPWLLDCIFFPEQAKDYPCFRIEYDAVLHAIGIPSKEKFDWFSYNELQAGRHKLDQEAARIKRIDSSDQTVVQRLTFKLAVDLFKFETLTNTLEPLRWEYATTGSAELDDLFGSKESSLVQILAEARSLSRMATGTLNQETEDFAALQNLFKQIDAALDISAGSAALVPPPAGSESEDTWLALPDLVMAAFQEELGFDQQREVLMGLERLEAVKGDQPAFESELRGLHANLVAMAEARGEYDTISLEQSLYRLDPFTNALACFILGFLLLAMGWMFPGNRWLLRGIWAAVATGVALAIAGIVMRCIIRSRPPVVSLYDTILFITSAIVLVSMFLEKITRQRIAIGMASILGAAGMFLAMRYELKEIVSAGDTMASVVAVLDTNYYLAIHVTTITLGYAGGLLAGALAHVWILGQLFGFRSADKKFYKSLLRMVYGIICFCLLFAIFGTIMGGVWANDSWGRFWGWDPKENGALLICIWGLLILHLRMGGYIKDRGLAAMAVIGDVVVSASWWGVNLLNVGLHSYGFTSGVGLTLMAVWAFEALILGLCGLDMILRRTRGTPV